MANLPHDRLQAVLRDKSLGYDKLGTPKIKVAPAVPVPHPTVTLFIERVAGFHEGSLPLGVVPRLQSAYDILVSYLISFMIELARILPWADTRYKQEGVKYDVPGVLRRRLYNKFHIPHPYPFHNLVQRLGSALGSIRDSHPRFQTTFLLCLPDELFLMIFAYLDDQSIGQIAQTCRRFRLFLLPVLFKSAYFHMRYTQNSSYRNATNYNNFQTLLGAVIREQRADCGESIRSFLTDAFRVRNIRFISFDNEWGCMWPETIPLPLLLSPTVDIEIYEPLYSAIVAALSALAVVHVRFVSIPLASRVIAHIKAHPTITRLTVESSHPNPFPRAFTMYRLVRLVNIVFLGLGFHGDSHAHRLQWLVMSLCPLLRHLLVYAISEETVVCYPTPPLNGALHHLHFLVSVDIRGSARFINPLIEWFSIAGAEFHTSHPGGVVGSIRQFRLHSHLAIDEESISELIHTLGRNHPHLTSLVLDGIRDVPDSLMAQIAASFPNLESLSLMRLTKDNKSITPLCEWQYPSHVYAQAMSGLDNLRHFEANFTYSSETYTGRALETLVAITKTQHDGSDSDLTDSDSSVSSTSACYGDWTDSCDSDCTDDVSVALPFAAFCPRLETFAIRAAKTHYSCEIRRNGGMIYIVDAREDYDPQAFERWNPTYPNTWASLDWE